MQAKSIVVRFCTTFLVSSVCAAPAVAAPGQFCTVVKTDGSPVVDGKRDALYDAGYPIDGLSHPRLLSLARLRTSAKFIHDGKRLYAFVRCEDPNATNMPAWSAKRDDSTMWKGDAIELFFLAKDGLKHFIFSPTGGVYDAAGHPDDANTWMFDVSWNSGIKSAVSNDGSSWCVEFSLPLSDIPGREMAFNLVRDSPDARKCVSWARLEESAKWILPADRTESIYGRIKFIDAAPGGFDFIYPPMIRPNKENYCLVRLAKAIPTDGFKLEVQGKAQKPWGSFESGRFGWTYNLDMKAKGDKDAVFTVEGEGGLLFRQVSAIPAGYIMIRPSNLARGKLYLNSNRGMKAKLNWDCKHNYEGARMSNGGMIRKPFDIVFKCPPGVEIVSKGVRREGAYYVQHQEHAYLVPDYFSSLIATTLPAGSKGKISYAARYSDGVQRSQEVEFEVIDIGGPPKLKKFDVGHYNLYVRSVEEARAWAETGVNAFTMRGYSDEDAALIQALKAEGFRVVRGGYFWPGAVSGHSPWAVWTREDETARAKDINGRDIPLGAGLQISPSYRGRFFVESCRKEAEFCRKAGIYRFSFDVEDYIQKKGELGDFRPETIAYFKRRWAERHPGEAVPEPKEFERNPSAHPREHEAWVDAKCELWADFFREMKRLLSEGIGREVVFMDWSFNVFQTVEKRNHSLRNADFFRVFDVREHGFYSSIDRDVRQLERLLAEFKETFPGVKQPLSWCPSPVRYSLGRDSSDYYWSTMPAIDDEIVYSMYEAATFGCKSVFTFKAPMIDMEFHRQFINALNVIAKVEDIVVDGASRRLETNLPDDVEVYDKFFGRFDTWRNQRRVFCRANSLGSRTLISVSEYRDRKPIDVVVKFPHAGTVTVTDLESGEKVATLAEGEESLKVPLRDRRCRLLLAEEVRSGGQASVSLDGEWRLEWRPEEEGGEWKGVVAHVPGDTYLALQEAGVMPDLSVGTNVWGVFSYEQCEWRYSRRFDAPQRRDGERLRLRFDGVDTRATYFLNGERIGESANMHVPVEFDVTDAVRASDNLLEVRIASPLGCGLLPVPGRTREGGTDVEGVRKAMHMFGWDIMPRVVTSGIWRSVRLEVVPQAGFGDVHWMTFSADPATRTASIRVDCQILAPRRLLHKSKLRLSLSRGGRTLWSKEHVVRFFQTVDRVKLSDVDLWWPRGSGEAALYDAVAELVGEDGRTLARDERKFGIRTIVLERDDWRSEGDPGTFRFVVNGEPIFMHGCDWSPLDALHSRDGQHLGRACGMLADLNCNMVRMWGGGVYEPDAFFDFCDANGILVWQDFAMGNVTPPQDDAFAAEIYREAKSLILRLRSHPSLAVWCANNEIDRAIHWSMFPFAPDPNRERVSREVLPRVLREFDPLRPYLPSSPYWTPDVVAGRAKLSQDHIWSWKFCRDPVFTNSTATFVSEMGRHGCPNLDSLKRMMRPENLYPWPDPARQDRFNVDWNCKCTKAYPDYPEWSGDGRNRALTTGCKGLYGEVPKDLAEFVDASQTVQANALKTWIELYRSRKGRMWGVLWWNLRDGWPIISDGVVDWYFGKKRAYGWIKAAQRPVLVAAAYDGGLKAFAVNDRREPVTVKAKFTDKESGRVILERTVEVPANGKVDLGQLHVEGQGLLAIDYDACGEKLANHFLYGEPPFAFRKVLEWTNGL